MGYRKINLEVAIDDADAEILIQALGDAMDKIETQLTVFASEIVVVETSEPENAKEIAAPAV